MKHYVIDRQNNQGVDYCEIKIDGVVKYCYYEKNNNKFVNRVYFIIGNNYRIGDFLDNSIYVFCQGISRIRGMVEVLKQEFQYLDYVFVFNDDKDKAGILSLVSDVGIEVVMWSFEEYFKRNRIWNDDENISYLSNNMVEKEKRGIDYVDKTFADYNGFNERLIDDNVKNIVKVRRNSGGDSNEL